jgi:hypothetical protein
MHSALLYLTSQTSDGVVKQQKKDSAAKHGAVRVGGGGGGGDAAGDAREGLSGELKNGSKRVVEPGVAEVRLRLSRGQL